ncbi:AAA family ATPase [Flavobacterium rakeshii]|uniref:AAA family ATPase n=1 Tax=Flavobacterium rakeshii TaxID=1038845 RepID=A0A6N8HCK8_9FLAO|nr:ATP-binding protein [Flavobacterium rakeshii]MUV03285.1 AAA family ATPase [Flavobacterium rakeshii]
MLVQFSIQNFKTFRKKSTISFVASNYDKIDLEESNVVNIENFQYRLLKSAVIYGSNASGKTKFLDAAAFLRWFIINSSTKTQEGDKINVQPFAFNTHTEKKPSEFEIIFIIDDTQYRYGFEANKKKIISEWLYQKKLNLKPKEVELFYREKSTFTFHKLFKKFELLQKEGDIIRDNALILSLANQFKVKVARKLVKYFEDLSFLLGNEPNYYEGFSLNQIAEKSEIGIKIIETIKRFDIGISDINVKEIHIDNDKYNNLPKEILNKFIELKKKEKEIQIIETEAIHKKYDIDYNFVSSEAYDFDNTESAGTQKLLALLGPIFESLTNGSSLFIDELDSRLHPNIVSHLIKLFNSSESNPKNAQLIFNTHNSNLLNENIFRRDQIWFVQKNRYGEAEIYSLADIKIRKNSNFEEKYLQGSYGGVPYIENLSDLFNSPENENEK